MPASVTVTNRPSGANRRDVAKAKREEGDSTEIEISGKDGFFPRCAERRAERPVQEGIAEDQTDRPDAVRTRTESGPKKLRNVLRHLPGRIRRAIAAHGVHE